MTDNTPTDDRSAEPGPGEQPTMGDLFEGLEELEGTVDSKEEREQVRETMRLAMDVSQPGVFGKIVYGYDREDAAQAMLGALLFGIPMFVEGGTNEVGAFIATRPLYLLGTHVFAFLLVIGILYVSDIQDVRMYKPIFGIVPRRLVGVTTISLGTAILMMTLWGRINWADPWLAFSTASVAYVPMAIGASLGDIIPD